MTTTERRGLTLSVYRDASRGGDCSLGGISSTHTRLTVVGVLRHLHGPSVAPRTEELPATAQISAPSTEAPAVWLVCDRARPGDVFVVPAGDDGQPAPTTRYMFGGNLAHGHDGRFLRLTGNHYGVRIHDRCEGPQS